MDEAIEKVRGEVRKLWAALATVNGDKGVGAGGRVACMAEAVKAAPALARYLRAATDPRMRYGTTSEQAGRVGFVSRDPYRTPLQLLREFSQEEPDPGAWAGMLARTFKRDEHELTATINKVLDKHLGLGIDDEATFVRAVLHEAGVTKAPIPECWPQELPQAACGLYITVVNLEQGLVRCKIEYDGMPAGDIILLRTKAREVLARFGVAGLGVCRLPAVEKNLK